MDLVEQEKRGLGLKSDYSSAHCPATGVQFTLKSDYIRCSNSEAIEKTSISTSCILSAKHGAACLVVLHYSLLLPCELSIRPYVIALIVWSFFVLVLVLE